MRAAQDEASIRAFFEKYSHADLSDPTVRDTILDYFVDKIYLYEDRVVETGWYTDLYHEIAYDVYGEDLASGEGFEYLPEASSGSVCLAAGGNLTNNPRTR